MSWSRRGALFGLGALVLSGPGLAGCGFRPLYARPGPAASADPASVGAHLAAIRIATPRWKRSPSPFDEAGNANFDARVSQILHNALRDGLNPYAPPAASAYDLDTKLSETIGSVLSIDAAATIRETINLTADFELTDAAGKTLLADTARARVSYLIEPQQPYNTIAARNDARQRAARQLAEFMKLRLSAFFADRG